MNFIWYLTRAWRVTPVIRDVPRLLPAPLIPARHFQGVTNRPQHREIPLPLTRLSVPLSDVNRQFHLWDETALLVNVSPSLGVSLDTHPHLQHGYKDPDFTGELWVWGMSVTLPEPAFNEWKPFLIFLSVGQRAPSTPRKCGHLWKVGPPHTALPVTRNQVHFFGVAMMKVHYLFR